MRSTWVLLALAACLFLASCTLAGDEDAVGPGPAITIHSKTFKVDVALTPEEQGRGLAGREGLAEDQGMLFVYKEPARRTFWMKEMLFPIDILFIRGNEVVGIVAAAPPPSDRSELKRYRSPLADKVLEINAGLSGKYGFRVGDEVRFKEIPAPGSAAD